MGKGSSGRGGRMGLARGTQGRAVGGRVSAGRLKVGDRVFRPGDTPGRGGFEVSRVNSSSYGVTMSGGAGGRISKRDLVGGIVQRGGRFIRIG